MKILHILSTLTLFITQFSLWGQSSLLWKVEGGNITEPVYLFGTVHIIPADQFEVTSRLDSVAAASDRFVFEMDLNAPQLQMEILKALKIDSVKNLKELYTPKEYKKLSKAMEKHGLSVAMFEQFKPLMAQQQLMQLAVLKDTKGYETYFLAKARELGKLTGGLDEPEVQLAALKAISLKDQAKSLYETALNPKKSAKELNKMYEVYKSQDVEAIYKYIADADEFSSLNDPLLIVRNKRWVQKMKEEMFGSGEKLFIAVGAAHLGGPEGLISLLRSEGYNVNPVPVK